MRNVLRENANLVVQIIMIANGVKNVIKKDVLVLVKVMQFAQKGDTVTLMTKFAFYLANLIKIVLVAINAQARSLGQANV